MSDKKSSFAELMDAKKDWLEALNQPDTRPFVKCKTCGIKYKRKGDTRFYGGIKDDGNCSECFCKQLRSRDLTEEELDTIAKDYIEKRDYENEKRGLYALHISLPGILNESQCEAVRKHIDKLDDEKEQKRKEELHKKYVDQVLEIAKKSGYEKDDFTSNFMDFIADLLKEIDDRIEKGINSVRPTIFR